MEEIPLGDETVDVIISNGVISMSPRKHQVFREAWRVLKPGRWETAGFVKLVVNAATDEPFALAHFLSRRFGFGVASSCCRHVRLDWRRPATPRHTGNCSMHRGRSSRALQD